MYKILLNYIKQETLVPIRGALRWIAYGFAACVLLSIGLVFGALGILRLVQTQTPNDSWVGYVLTIVACTAIGALAYSRIRRGTLEKK